MDWVDALQRLRESRTPAVIVTLAMVRGHAPRNGGAKLIVSPDALFGTVGGGTWRQRRSRRRARCSSRAQASRACSP
nr:hypothetical protein GCM10025699_31550 [Microbacterium flavescens]